MTEVFVGRFLKKIIKADGCWLWGGFVCKKSGYGVFHPMDELQERAHRFSYRYFKGPIIPPLVIDHLCRNRRCVNPAHLELVTRKENTLRGEGEAAKNAAKTACKRGHPFTLENTIHVIAKKGRWRSCRECKNEKERARYHRVRLTTKQSNYEN